jgi:hypothetical protein
MFIQQTIDFSSVVHHKENNRHSEMILEENYERLNKNCKVLYDALMRGERLTGADVVTRYDMMEYRRRFKDLKDAGVPIQTEKLPGGSKVWFIKK